MDLTITPINESLNFVLDENQEQTVCEMVMNDHPIDATRQLTTEVILRPHSRLNYVVAICPLPGTQSALPILQKKMRFVLQEGSYLNVIGLFLGQNKEQHKIKTFIDHVGPGSTSNVLIKGVLKDEAHNSFQGLIKIEKSAPQSSAHLEQKILLLSKLALAEGQPELEILNNEVTASHAASIGKISEEQLFYMETRGIDKNMAQKMIIKGFFSGLIREINDKKLKTKIQDLFNKAL